jgi:hypothetical protein
VLGSARHPANGDYRIHGGLDAVGLGSVGL